MQPQWFVEAFAIIAADQRFGEELKLDTVEAASPQLIGRTDLRMRTPPPAFATSSALQGSTK
jgi:hypothetical protein